MFKQFIITDEKIRIAKIAIKNHEKYYEFKNKRYRITLGQKICCMVFENQILGTISFLAFRFEKWYYFIFACTFGLIIFPILAFEFISNKNVDK